MIDRVLLTDVGEVSVVQEPHTMLDEGEVRVAIKAAGICGSDLHYFRHGGLGSHKQPLPMQMGHEPAGIIVESNSDSIKVGDRVAVEPSNPDLNDEWSLKGRHNLSSGTFMGANANGCMCDEVVVEDHQCVVIPDNMSYGAASLLEPVAVGFHAINRSGVNYQNSVAIYGCGPVGLCLLLSLKKIGVTEVYCVDPIESRQETAIGFGATEFVDSPPKCDVVFDVCGTNESLDSCIRTCGAGSKLVMIGIPETDTLTINPHLLRIREVDFINVRRSDRTLIPALNLFRDDSRDLDKMVTHCYNIDECQKAFDTASGYKDGVIKAIFTPNEGLGD